MCISLSRLFYTAAVVVNCLFILQGLVLEVSIDSTLNATLEVTRGGVVDSVSSPLDLDKYRIMHSITVHSLGGR